jgi:hypothetical protein
MESSVPELLRLAIAAAEAQLLAARALDMPALREANAARQEVQFELDLVDIDNIAEEERSEVRALASELKTMDDRLTRVLDAGLRVFKAVAPQGAPPAYTADGRLRGGDL